MGLQIFLEVPCPEVPRSNAQLLTSGPSNNFKTTNLIPHGLEGKSSTIIRFTSHVTQLSRCVRLLCYNCLTSSPASHILRPATGAASATIVQTFHSAKSVHSFARGVGSLSTCWTGSARFICSESEPRKPKVERAPIVVAAADEAWPRWTLAAIPATNKIIVEASTVQLLREERSRLWTYSTRQAVSKGISLGVYLEK